MDSRSVPSKIQNQQSSIGNPFLYHLLFHLALDLLDDFPELLTRIKIDLKRLFVTVIDHTTGPDHQ
jgi:hypothetical protein